jgi:hypothetical protein
MRLWVATIGLTIPNHPLSQGFRDLRWALRNSALMVFGSLVIAAVGSGKNALGSSSGGSSGSGSGQAAGKGPTAQSRCDGVVIIIYIHINSC